MKLSDAIRLGAMLKPQMFDDFGDGTATCAMGAACEAVGVPAESVHSIQAAGIEALGVEQGWRLKEINGSPCPVDGCWTNGNHYDFHMVPHLNDVHRWTRERIADWVESVERALDAQSPSAGEAPAVEPIPVSVGDSPAR